MFKELNVKDTEKVKRIIYEKKKKKMTYEQNGNIYKEIENLKRNQEGIVELKNIVTEMKCHWRDSEAYLSRQKKKKISEPKDRMIEVTKSEKKKKIEEKWTEPLGHHRETNIS